VSRLIVLLDVGGVINEKRQQTAQFQHLVGTFFASQLGGTPEAWNEAHRIITGRFLGQREAIQRAVPDFIRFHRAYERYWVGGMCKLMGRRVPPEEQCLELADHAIAAIASRVRAALPGVAEAIHTLHDHGYTLHTASGAVSFEIAGYLQGLGVQ